MPGATVVEGADVARRAFDIWRAYPKLSSWLLLHAAGVPTLPGVVVSEWDTTVATSVERFAAQFGGRVLVRSDASPETADSPRGGFVVSLHEAPRVVRDLLGDGRVVFLLEPASPFDDLYSLTLEPAPGWREWYLEVVGPGFDASDLKRGDLTPHERIWLVADESGISIHDRQTASPEVQSSGRAIRAQKIARMLGCEEGEVEDQLRRRGEPMFADNPSYPAVSSRLLDLSIASSASVRSVIRSNGLDDRGVSISLSFLGQAARPVFWDVVMPGMKYALGG